MPAEPFESDVTLVLGGARSGKSRHAEQIIQTQIAPWLYVATAQPFDGEMSERIALHRARRDDRWTTFDAPHDLPAALGLLPPGQPLLVDCLTLWLTNRMLADADLDADATALEAALRTRPGPIVLVSNEVGLSIVPDNALARRFRDAQGQLNQRIAALADRVIFMVAGLPMQVK